MDPGVGELLTRWTVRLAVGCYVVRLWIDASGHGRTWAQAARWCWSIGCALFLLHVVCAFQFYHGWSHQAAYEHTARETAAVVGINWGGGLYFNYVFALVWTADTAAWWLGGDAHSLRRCWYWTLQTVFAFMMLNATAVFGPGFWKWVAGGVVIALSWRAGRVRRNAVQGDS